MFDFDRCADAVRDYLGARIAMYFGFAAHLTAWMRWPAILSVACTAAMWAEVAVFGRPRRRSRVLPLFAAAQCVWAVAVLETWRRREYRYALGWGMLGGDGEPDRPEFAGVLRPSLIDGKPETYFPAAEKAARARTSTCVTGVAMALVIAMAALPIAVRVILQQRASGYLADYADVLAAVVATAQIEVMNRAYTGVAAGVPRQTRAPTRRRAARRRSRIC